MKLRLFSRVAGWVSPRHFIIAVVLLLSAISIFGSRHAFATNPGIINFQGKVTNANGTNVTDGTYNFDFVLYDDPTLGTPSDGVHDKWHELTKSVTVTSGVFQTYLGSATTLPDFNANPSLYLAVRFNADAAGYMSPRVQLASVPYAINADKIGGVSVTSLGQLAQNQTWTGTNTFQPSTNITSAIIKQTSAASPTADIFNVQTANGTSILQVTGPTANEAAVSLNSVGATRALTLDSGSGTIVLGTNTTTIQKAGTALTIDLNSASNGTLTITDSGTGAASLSVEGNITTTATVFGNTIDRSTAGALSIGTGGASAATSITVGSSSVTATSFTTGTLSVQSSTGPALITIDTTATNLNNNIITNPGIEAAIAGNWTAKNGSGTSTLTKVATPVYDGTGALQIATSGTATNAGASDAGTLTLNATYVYSLYVKAAATNFSTFEMGYTNTGGDNACLTAKAVLSSGWTLYTCSFTVTTTAGSAVYVKQTDAVNRTFFIDAVTLETNANASSNYRDGKITLAGVVSSPLILQDDFNSTNALVVQNANGTNIFTVDSTDTNLVNNPGIEVSTTNWAGKSTGTLPTISRDATTAYLGNAALKTVTGTTAQDGVKFTFPDNTTLLASTQYTFSFFAKISAGSLATFSFGRSDTGAAGGETSCVTTGSLTTIWTRFTCSFTTGATMGASGNPYIYMSQGTGTTSTTFWVDSVVIEPGATMTPYGAGALYLNGVISSPVSIQNKFDSSSAFQIFNAASASLFVADTANGKIVIGSPTTDSTQVLLQLDSFSTFADTATCSTTNNQGALYYNTATNTVRGCVNGVWEDMVSTAGLGLQLFGVVPDTGANPGDLAAVSGSQNGPCKVSEGASTSTVSWTACTAYSGGRKVLVAAGTATTSAGTSATIIFQHLCLTGTGNQPTLSAIGIESANLSTVSMPSVTSPILCLADIKVTNGSAVITSIYDTRTYTTTLKETVSIGTTAPANGMLAQYIATKGVVIPMATSVGNNLAGVVVATTGATSTTTINGIIAVSGPAAVKAINGTNLVGAYLFGTTTAGYATTVATKPAEGTGTIYNLIGIAKTAWTNACATNSDSCAGSILTSIDKR